MNTIRELKQQEKYKNMMKRKNKEKDMYKTANSTLKIKYEGIKKLLEKKDKEIERLTYKILTLEEIIRKTRGLFYEKCRITQNGAYIFNEVDYEELSNILGSDKK